MPPELQKAQQRKLPELAETGFSLYDGHLQLDKFDHRTNLQISSVLSVKLSICA